MIYVVLVFQGMPGDPGFIGPPGQPGAPAYFPVNVRLLEFGDNLLGQEATKCLPSPVARDSGEKPLLAKQLVGFEPTTSHTMVNC